MRILGIDPGLNFTGWGIIDSTKSTVSFVACDVISSSAKKSMSIRLHNIYKNLKIVIDTYKPNVVVIEETFVNKDPRGALKLGQARGIILMVPAIYNLNVFEYSPNVIKKVVAGNGHATKEQVKTMLQFIMPKLKEIEVKNDATDALSIAICHSYHKII